MGEYFTSNSLALLAHEKFIENPVKLMISVFVIYH